MYIVYRTILNIINHNLQNTFINLQTSILNSILDPVDILGGSYEESFKLINFKFTTNYA